MSEDSQNSMRLNRIAYPLGRCSPKYPPRPRMTSHKTDDWTLRRRVLQAWLNIRPLRLASAIEASLGHGQHGGPFFTETSVSARSEAYASRFFPHQVYMVEPQSAPPQTKPLKNGCGAPKMQPRLSG